VPVEDELQDAANMGHFVRGQRCLPVDVRIAAGFEQAIALAQRPFQRLGQHEQGLAARLRSTGFDEADVTGGEARMHRQIELTHSACRPPLTEKVSGAPAELLVGCRCGRPH